MARRQYSDEDLIAIMREAAGTLKRIPTMSDFDQKRIPGLKRTPASYTYKTRFGRYSNALRKAFGPHEAHRQTNGLADEDKLVRDMKDLYARLGRVPTAAEMSAHPSAHHANTYIRHYGSWRQAVEHILPDA